MSLGRPRFRMFLKALDSLTDSKACHDPPGPIFVFWAGAFSECQVLDEFQFGTMCGLG